MNMMTLAEILIYKQCGTMSWICCIPRDQFPTLVSKMQGASPGDALFVYDMLCGTCGTGMVGAGGTVPGEGDAGGPAQPPPAADPQAACASTLSSVLCSAPGQVLLTAAQGALGAAVVATPEPASKAALTALIVALEAIDSECDGAGIQAGTVAALCTSIAGFLKWYSDANIVLKGILLPVKALVSWGPLTLAINQCCTGDVTTAPGDAVPANVPGLPPINLPGLPGIPGLPAGIPGISTLAPATGPARTPSNDPRSEQLRPRR